MNTVPAMMLEQLRTALTAERERLARGVADLLAAERALAISQGEESAACGQQADVASDLVESEIDVALERAERRRLAEVDAALTRLGNGRYGRCERCGESIPLARLEAIPWTRYCRDCTGRRVGGR